MEEEVREKKTINSIPKNNYKLTITILVLIIIVLVVYIISAKLIPQEERNKESDKEVTTTPTNTPAIDKNTIGAYLFGSDKNENFYILDQASNGSVVKYDKDGNILYTSIQKYDLDNINNGCMVYKDTLYIIAKIDEQLYLIDIMSEEKYILEGLNDYFASPNMQKDALYFKYDNSIKIARYDAGGDIYLYTFDPVSKTLNRNEDGE